jgi:hypothetical protein
MGFRDVCHMLEGGDVFWDSLLPYVLSKSKLMCIVWVMSNIYFYFLVWVITYVLCMITSLLLLLVLYVFLPDFVM